MLRGGCPSAAACPRAGGRRSRSPRDGAVPSAASGRSRVPERSALSGGGAGASSRRWRPCLSSLRSYAGGDGDRFGGRILAGAEQVDDAVGHGIRVAEQLERVHPQVVPAEPTQQLRSQSQRLAQAHVVQHHVGLDGEALAPERGHQPELAAVPERDLQPAALKAPGQVDEHRVAVVGNRFGAGARVDVAQDAGEREGAVMHPVFVEVLGVKQVTITMARLRAGHRHGEQPFAAGLAERSEVGEHAAVRGAAESDREDHPVAALRDGAFDGGDGERFGAVAQNEVVQQRPGRQCREDRRCK